MEEKEKAEDEPSHVQGKKGGWTRLEGLRGVGLEGSANGHWWLDTLGKTLDEGIIFERVGSRQLAGLLISVWARKKIRKYIGDIDAAAVACGFGHAIGNKGSVGLRMRVYDRVICFANCHFAAHLDAVNKRNSDFHHIYRTMSFSRPPSANISAPAGSSSAVQLLYGPNVTGFHSDDGVPELSEADMIVFLGDFNYRLHGITYDEARDMISQRCFDWLREKDQLKAEMEAGKVFQGMREGLIKFPPTYKFARHEAGLSGYDSGEKKRIPAWCDRILYRDSRSIYLEDCSLECPIVCSILQYDACLDVTDSDHKPVKCLLRVAIACIDELSRRQQFGEIISGNARIKSIFQELYSIPETTVGNDDVVLTSLDTTTLCITNKSEKEVIFDITCDGRTWVNEDGILESYPRGDFGLPQWLEVSPAHGIIKPGQRIEASLHYEEPQTLEELVDGIPQYWWNEDTRDKEVFLVVNTRNSLSSNSNSHRIRVRSCLSSSDDFRCRFSSRQSMPRRRSEPQFFASSMDTSEDTRILQSP